MIFALTGPWVHSEAKARRRYQLLGPFSPEVLLKVGEEGDSQVTSAQNSTCHWLWGETVVTTDIFPCPASLETTENSLQVAVATDLGVMVGEVSEQLGRFAPTAFDSWVQCTIPPLRGTSSFHKPRGRHTHSTLGQRKEANRSQLAELEQQQICT